MRKKSWLLFLYGLPAESKTARVNLWRKLKRFGAIQRISAYILPDEPTHLERFQWLAKQVRDEGGEASVIQTRQIDGLADDDIISLFQRERGDDYKRLKTEIQEALKNVKKSAAELPSTFTKLRKRFQEIKEIDYFTSPQASEVAALLHSAHSGAGSRSAIRERLHKEDFLGKIWLTRPRPEIDRVGSAWLIQRFIDPKATFVFSPKPDDAPTAIPFDMNNVEFTHHGDDCTFETLLKRFRFTNKPLKILGEMIHDADLEDGKFGRVEGLGVEMILKGLGKTPITDEEILARGFACFDGIYEVLRF